MRTAEIYRKTNETEIKAVLDLECGEKEIAVDTGIGFFDHMLTSFSLHGGFGLTLKVSGDLHVDCHHTIEDTGIVLGKAFAQALGDKSGIRRFADGFVPMDEALALASVDISGRPFLVFNAQFDQAVIGGYDSCMTEEFFRAFAFAAGITLHLRLEYGSNSHHCTEALFKAAARVIGIAVTPTGSHNYLSTKGVIET